MAGGEKISQLGGLPIIGKPLSHFCASGTSFYAPFRFADKKFRVARFDWDGKAWVLTALGEPFGETPGETEPCIQKQGERFLVSVRCDNPKGRLYVSRDGLNFRPLTEWKNHTVPRTLNKGLDGSLYLTTNTGPGYLRNPLLAYPLIGDSFGQPVIIHDQDGVRDDNGEKIPFVDHARAVNVFLEGRWRHLLLYRVCDLKERTLYGFQQSLVKKFHGDGGPIPKRPTSGLYIAELEYGRVAELPWRFAEEDNHEEHKEHEGQEDK
jgi:hypothetical protein